MDDEKEAVETADRLAALNSPAEEKEVEPQAEAETAEKPEKTPEPVEEAPEAPDAKAFQAMRQEIKTLREQLKTQPTADSEPLVPRIESQPNFEPTVNQNQYFDSNTGEFDAEGYARAVEQRAIAAANTRAQQLIDEEKQTNEAYAAFPELNPQNKDFDQDLYDATSAILLQSMVKGTKVTAKQAAEKALGLSKKALKEAAAEGAQKELNDIAAKEAASLEATANSGRSSQDYSDLEVLSDRSRKGGDEGTDAIAERIKRSGF